MGKTFSSHMMAGQMEFSLGTVSFRSASSKPVLAATTPTLASWHGRYHERRQMRKDLPKLTDEMLRDLNLTRRQASELAYRPFWRE